MTRWALAVAQEIRSGSSPEEIILFGSGADGRFREGSDLDLLLVYRDLPTLRQGRKDLMRVRPFSVACPVDLIFVTRAHYDEFKSLGGVCFVAFNEGIKL